MTKEEELQTLREENRTLKALVAELGTIQKRVLRHRFSIVGATSDPSPTQNHMLRMHEADFNPIETVSQHPFLNGLLPTSCKPLIFDRQQHRILFPVLTLPPDPQWLLLRVPLYKERHFGSMSIASGYVVCHEVLPFVYAHN